MRTPNHNDLAILVIDMQERYLSSLQERRMLIAAQQEVLRYAAREDVPVAVIEMANMDPTIDEIRKEVKNALRQAYITKEDLSGFRYTHLENHLKSWKRRTLLLMGVYAGACVQETAQDGKKKDFTVVTHARLIGDSKWHMEQALAWYQKKGCLLTDYKQFLGL